MHIKFCVLFALVLILVSTVNAQSFYFNDGTLQDWSNLGPYDDLGNGPYFSNFSSLVWSDNTNYPNSIWYDNVGDLKGSATFGVDGVLGITGSPGTYWKMYMLSPDVSDAIDWQWSEGFTVELIHTMGTQTGATTSIWAQLGVTVLDTDSNKVYEFNSGIPKAVSSYSWQLLQFDWSSEFDFPQNYIIQGVSVIVWGRLDQYYYGDIFIDEVIPQIGSPIKITSPNGGEIWESNTYQTITWQTLDVGSVNIEYSTDGGTGWYAIAASVQASLGAYTFLLPNVSSNNCLVRITDSYNSQSYDISNNPFSITVSKSILIQNPGFNSVWQTGQENYIKWTDNISEKVKIELLVSSTNTLEISSATESDGSFLWLVPADVPSARSYRIKITSVLDTTVTAYSKSFRIVQAPFINITSPTSKAIWQFGTTQNILWEDNIEEYVKIDLFKAGEYITAIIDSTASDSTYSYLVPLDLSAGVDYQIRIISTVDPLVEDFSENFSIVPPSYISITSPNASSVWHVGATQSIQWIDNIDASVKIDFYKGGSFLSTITSSTESDSTYTFEVPMNIEPASNYQIRIVSTVDSQVGDFSENFKISVPPPVANFDGTPILGVDTLTVSFHDLSTGQVNGWLWDFGDGGTSKVKNPVHFYRAVGAYTVSLTVTGPGGSNTKQLVGYINVSAFSVNVPETNYVNVNIPVTINYPPDFNPSTNKLYFRRGGESTYISTNLTKSGDLLLGEIPLPYVTIRGVEFYISISDGQNTLTYPVGNPQTHPAAIRVNVQTLTAPVNLKIQKYQMVSVPLELSDQTIASVWGDDFGTYNVNKWRVFHYEPSTLDYLEHPNIENGCTPGTAFWLVVRDATSFDIENGLSVETTNSYPVELQPGWNQIANPFAFPVAWSNVGNSSLLNQTPVFWNPESEEYEYNQTTLNPWTGYFIYNDPANGTLNINFPPKESAGFQKRLSFLNSISESEFVLNINATGKNSNESDIQNYLGMLKAASDELGHEDFLEAPPIKGGVHLSIVKDEQKFAGNFISVSKEGACWEMELKTSEDEEVQLNVEYISHLPEGFSVKLVDLDRQQNIPMTNSSLRIYSSKDETRHLRIVIGTEEYVDKYVGSTESIIEKFELHQNYPNPFNPTTSIEYGILTPQIVTLKVYNILGREITTLVNKHQEPGIYKVEFDGGRLASGVYFYQLKAGSFTETRKMILLE